MKRIFILLTIITFILTKICFSQVAVFPFEDFTYKDYGVNLNVPRKIAQALKKRGVKVIFPSKIIPILVKFHHVDFNKLNFTLLRVIYKELKSRYVLLGSIGELRKDPPEIFMVLRLIDTLNGKVKWGKVIAFSEKDYISFLNLKKISYEEMVKEVYKSIATNFYEPKAVKEHIFPTIDVQEVIFSSRHVKPGAEVKCLLRFYFSGKKPDQMILLVGGNEKVEVEPYKGAYLADWIAESKEGGYPVYLVAKWLEPFKFEKKIFIGKYYVDTSPPKVALVIKGARKEDGKVFVKDVLKIFPKLLEERGGGFSLNRGISRWKVEVYCKRLRKVVFKEERPGAIPGMIVWDLKSMKGALPPGEYKVMFIAWDLAGNKGEVEKKFYIVKEPPMPTVMVYKGRKRGYVYIDAKKGYIPLIKVSIEVFNGKGKVIAKVFKEGIDIKEVKKKVRVDSRDLIPPFYFDATIQDELNNIRIVKRGSVEVKTSKRGPGYNTWVPEF
ncbi:MAG: hypothetical protein GXO57_03650 [Thermodesulfobacteria bacterium]|nr:hypothetical protein [Thermodesulfobacteriota bacterium]